MNNMTGCKEFNELYEEAMRRIYELKHNMDFDILSDESLDYFINKSKEIVLDIFGPAYRLKVTKGDFDNHDYRLNFDIVRNYEIEMGIRNRIG